MIVQRKSSQVIFLIISFLIIALLYFVNHNNKKGKWKSSSELQYCEGEIQGFLKSNLSSSDTIWKNFADKFLKYQCIYSVDSNLLKAADEFHYRGNVQLNGNLEWARTFHLSALKLRKLYYRDSLHVDILRSWSNIATTYLYEGRYYEALIYFDSVQIDDSRFELVPQIYNLTKTGECYRYLGDYNQSIQHLSKALNTISKYIHNEVPRSPENWAKSSRFIHDLIANLCLSYQDMLDFHSSYETGIYGIDIIRNHTSPDDTLNKLAKVYLILGNTLLDSAKSLVAVQESNQVYKGAMEYYNSALHYYSQLPDTANMITCFRNLGTVYFNRGDYQKAIEILQKGLQLGHAFYKGRSHEDIIALQINLGSSLVKMKQVQAGLQCYQNASRLFEPEKEYRNGIPSLASLLNQMHAGFYLLGSLGRTHLLLSDSSSLHAQLAHQSYDSLSTMLNYVRANLISDDAKLRLAQRSRLWIPDAVLDMTFLFLKTGDSFYKNQVYHFIEHGKAFALLEASRLNNASELLPEELQRLQSEVFSQEMNANSPSQVDEQLELKRRQFFNRLQKEAPSYYNLKFQGIRNNPQKVQHDLLKENQSLLEYFIHDSLLLILAIQKDTFLLDTVHVTKSELFRRVSEFRALMNPVDSTGRVSAVKELSFCKQSFELYQLLIGRVKDRIRLNQRLVIIPDGPLNDLSFDALLCQFESGDGTIPKLVRNEQFLVQQHAISYCFSASLLEEMKMERTDQPPKAKLTLFAPDFHKASTSLPYMIYQKEEIEGIQEKIPSAIVVEKSTKEQFIKTTKQHAFIHIATHGFDSPDPDHSFIAFDQKSIEPDSSQFLFLRELYHIPMKQELLTLTACETALGPLKEGEGNISLARGFAYAGVKAMITTLWKIQTNGASKIIPEFYRNFLGEGKPKDIALAESKRAYLKAGKAVYPDEWAGLILIGNADEFTQQPRSMPFRWLFYVSIPVVVLILFWKRSFRKAA